MQKDFMDILEGVPVSSPPSPAMPTSPMQDDEDKKRFYVYS